MNNTFGKNIIPDNDNKRLQALFDYDILDTPKEGAFDHIAEMAARMFNTPIALVSFVDDDRVWYKSNVGITGVEEVDRGVSLCSLVVLNDATTVFLDPENEPCLIANPLVAGEFGLKFYAGAPLRTPDGFNLGALCIVDKTPREFSAADQKMLENLAKIVMDEVELRYLRKKLASENKPGLNLGGNGK